MKKGLLGSTALVAASLVVGGAAQAEDPIQIKVGGYMEQWVGYVDQDNVAVSAPLVRGAGGQLDGVGTNSDTEIWFLGSTTLDNGITFGLNVQLEGNTSGDQIDESFAIIRGNFGEVNIGSENSAQYKMQTSAPEVGIGINSGDQTAWVTTAGLIGGGAGIGRAAFGSTFVEAGGVNDVNRITYYTPRFFGVQLGGSYVPSAAAEDGGFGGFDRNNFATATGLHDGYSFGANYNGEFSGVSLVVAGGYGQIETEVAGADNPVAYNVGARIGFMGVTVGGSYARSENNGAGTAGALGDAEGYDVGASYGMGPWAVSLAYFHGDRDGTAAGAIGAADHDTIAGSASYAVGPGINVKATIASVEFDDRSGNAAGADNDAFIFVMGPTFSF